MLKRLLGILFALAALATFVWVARGRYSSWCFGRGTDAVETLRCGDPSGSGHAADPSAPADSAAPAGSSGSSAPDAPAPAQPTAAKPLQ